MMESFENIMKRVLDGVELVSDEEAARRRAEEEKEERRLRVRNRLDNCGLMIAKNKQIKFEPLQQIRLDKILETMHLKMGVIKDSPDFESEYDKIMFKLAIAFPYLYGLNGCGKTAIAQRVAAFVGDEYDMDFIFVKATHLISDCQNNSERYKRTPVLFIDDLFVHRITPIVFDALFNIIDHRYEAGLPMMITSNVDPKGIVGKLMEVSNNNIAESMIRALIDRVFGSCYPMKLDGKSIRMRKTLERIEKEIGRDE